MLLADDLRLISRLHGGFPLTDHPFSDLASEFGCSEEALIERLRQCLSKGLLTRFGPLFQIEAAGGQFVLAAMAVPQERFDEVAALVNALPEVAHNYRRTHALNMWFVVGVERPELAQAALDRIALQTGLPVHAFPKEREYFVELRLPLDAGQPDDAAREAPCHGAG